MKTIVICGSRRFKKEIREFTEALGKPIYALEEDKEEPCRSVLIDEVIKTPTDLIKRLK